VKTTVQKKRRNRVRGSTSPGLRAGASQSVVNRSESGKHADSPCDFQDASLQKGAEECPPVAKNRRTPQAGKKKGRSTVTQGRSNMVVDEITAEARALKKKKNWAQLNGKEGLKNKGGGKVGTQPRPSFLNWRQVLFSTEEDVVKGTLTPKRKSKEAFTLCEREKSIPDYKEAKMLNQLETPEGNRRWEAEHRRQDERERPARKTLILWNTINTN